MEWTWETSGTVNQVEVFFGVYSDTNPDDLEWYCSEFGGARLVEDIVQHVVEIKVFHGCHPHPETVA